MKSRSNGITLTALIVTIVILLILAGVVVNLSLGGNGLIAKAQKASEETKKQAATEKMNMKIATAQMSTSNETQISLTLQELADFLYNDEEIEYVTTERKNVTNDKITVGNATSIFTKLKEYPYEFEINSSLQLASIDESKIINNGQMNNINVDNEHLLYLYNNLIAMMNRNNTIELLLDDPILFNTIISDNDNINYIVNNPDTFLNKVVNSENAVKLLAKNEYAKNKIRENQVWIEELQKCDYAYESWSQPKMTAATKSVTEGTITIKATGAGTGCPAYGAMDGKSSNGEGGYWWYNKAPAYWQVQFPYKLRIKGITFYNQYSTSSANMILTARLYTDSTRKTAIGNQFSASSAWQRISISGITQKEIITDTIYFYKTKGAAGIGELVISADKFLF